MNKCGTCRFWKPVDDSSDPSPAFFSEEITDKTWGQCGRIEMLESSQSPELAGCVDGSGYFAALRSKADFGCVLHELKQGDAHGRGTDATADG